MAKLIASASVACRVLEVALLLRKASLQSRHTRKHLRFVVQTRVVADLGERRLRVAYKTSIRLKVLRLNLLSDC